MKFVFFLFLSQTKGEIVATSMAPKKGSLVLQKKVDKVVEEYRDIFSSPIGVPFHYQVKHSINLTPRKPLPDGPVYHRSLLENEEIKR